jgi:predicted RNase H-like nuclease (RuvC/YqgF family)
MECKYQHDEEIDELEIKVETFNKEFDMAVTKAVNKSRKHSKVKAKSSEELLIKEFNGERKVLSTRIAALERSLNDTNAQIIKLNHQLARAYEQVQEVVMKAFEASANFKSITSLQQMLTEQARKSMQEK